MVFLCTFLLLSLPNISSARPSTASSSNLGTANDYNVFVFGNGTLETGGSTIEGRLAVGGLVKTKNYSVAPNVPGSDAQVPYNIVFGGVGNTTATTFSGTFYGSLVSNATTTTISVPDVRGNVHAIKALDLGGNNGWGGTVQGNALYGTTFRKDSNVTVNGQTQQNTTTVLPFSFATAESDLRNLSTRLKALAATGITTVQYGGITLNGTVAGLNVFNVSVASLNSCNSFTVNVPAGATVLINVTGSGSPAMQNFGITINGTDSGKVLWHFPDATSVGFGTSGGIEVKGSVLAPNAAVNFGNGQIGGTLVCKSLTATGLFKHVPFTGNLDGVPAAATLLSLSVSPTSVIGGQANATGTVTLSGAAPSGGAVVILGSNSGAAGTPVNVTVAAGQATATFPIVTSAVTMSTPVTISASYGGVGKSAPLTVNPPPAPTVLSFVVTPTSVLGGSNASAVVTLSAPAPSGGAVVSLSSANTGVATIPASVTIPAGATQSAAVTVTTVPVSTNTNVVLTATYNSSSKTATLAVTPPTLVSLSVAPASVKGGVANATGTVTLSSNAPAGGLTVALSSSVTGAATTPASVTVSAGSTTATFTVTSKSVGSDTNVTISATLAGVTKTATLEVLAPALFSVSVMPASVVGGNQSQGKATIDAPAPSGGLTVSLTSSSTKATVPNNVTIPAGATESASFAVTTVAVATDTTATITGTLNGTAKTAELTIEAPKLVSVTLNPTSVQGGIDSTGTVTISSAAPDGGFSVALSSDLDKATVPASVMVAAGATTTTFTASTVPVPATTMATITGEQNGVSKTATLTITAAPITLSTLSLNPESVVGGYPSEGTITLSAPAPAGGQVVTLFSSLPDVAKLASSPNPTVVMIPAGQTSVTFPITTVRVAINKDATIKAVLGTTTDPNASGLTKTLTILPIHLSALTVSPVAPSTPPDSVLGGTVAKGVVTISYPAPPGGLIIELQSGSPAVATVPVNVAIAAGQTTAMFDVATFAVAMNTSVTFTATLAGDPVETATDTLTVLAPDVEVIGLIITPEEVVGGQIASGLIRISRPAPFGGTVVTLSSSIPQIVNVPTQVTIPGGSTEHSFPIPTNATASDVTATVTATLGTTTASDTLTVTAPKLTGLGITPDIVVGGDGAKGAVNISGPAPVGFVVTLSSNSPLTQVPASVTVPVGQQRVIFDITTTAVESDVTTTVTASRNGMSVEDNLILRPKPIIPILLTLDPAVVVGGNDTTATVTISKPAPAGGVTIALTSSVNVANPPLTVSVAAGETTVSFPIPTSPVEANTNVTITATLNGVSVTADLTVLPAPLELVSLVLDPKTVVGGETSTATITISKPAPVGGLEIELISSSPVATVTTPVTIPAGQSSITTPVRTIPVADDTTVRISATFDNKTVHDDLVVTAPNLIEFVINPESVNARQSAVAKVTISSPAPAEGLTVRVLSSNTMVADIFTARIVIPGGATTATASVDAREVAIPTTVTFTATLRTVTKTDTLVVNPVPITVDRFEVNPSSAIGGTTLTGSLQLTREATAGGVEVAITSTDEATIPFFTVTVPEGQIRFDFPIPTNEVEANKNIVIKASLNGSERTDDVTLLPVPTRLIRFSVEPQHVPGGYKATVFVTLSRPAPAGGVVITLASNNPVASLPATLTIPEGSYAGNVSVNTVPVVQDTAVTLSGTLGSDTLTDTLTVGTIQVMSITAVPSSLLGGNDSTGRVTLSSAAPAGGAVVTLFSGIPAAIVPDSVTVPEGQTSATFPIHTVPVLNGQGGYISATLKVTVSVIFSVQAPEILSLSARPALILGGKQAVGTVTLTGPAPAGGFPVGLSSDRPEAIVPHSVTVPEGAFAVDFPITTQPVTQDKLASLSAGRLGHELNVKTKFTILKEPLTLISLTVNPVEVVGGESTVGTVLLSRVAPAGGITVTLNSDNGAASLPISVEVPEGQRTTTFVVSTTSVIASTRVTLAATLADDVRTATLTVQPTVGEVCVAANVSGIVVTPKSARGGLPISITVNLDGPAIAGGQIVTLQSGDPALVLLPDSVLVPEGQSSVTLTGIPTAYVPKQTVVLVSAKYHGVGGANATDSVILLNGGSGTGLNRAAGQNGSAIPHGPETGTPEPSARKTKRLTVSDVATLQRQRGFDTFGFPSAARLSGIDDIAAFAQRASTSFLGDCGPMDVAFVIDNSGSVGNEVESIKQQITDLIGDVAAASGGDFRLALVTFANPIVVRTGFTSDVNAFVQAISTIHDNYGVHTPYEPGLGGNDDEPSNEAISTVLNAFPGDPVNNNYVAGRAQVGDFNTPFRPNARKLIIMLTDELPGGVNRSYSEVEDNPYNQQLVALARQQGVTICSLSFPPFINGLGEWTPFAPEVFEGKLRPYMRYLAQETGGVYIPAERSDSSAVTALRDILARCGFGKGDSKIIYTVSDATPAYQAFTITSPNTIGRSREAGNGNVGAFSLVGIDGFTGVVAGSHLRRVGNLNYTGSAADAELGVATLDGAFEVYSPEIGRLQTRNGGYTTGWFLPGDFSVPIQESLGTTWNVEWIDRLSSICGPSAAVDTPGGNVLTVLFDPYGNPKVAGGASIDITIPDYGVPSVTGWDIVFEGEVIASAAQPNGWNVEADSTPYQGIVVSVPFAALPHVGYQVRVGFAGRSGMGVFDVVSANGNNGPPVIASFTIAPNPVVGGQSATGTVTLESPAPTGGVTISLAALSPVTVPEVVVIAAGQSTVSFPIATVSVPEPVTVSVLAQLPGQVVSTQLVVTTESSATRVMAINVTPPSIIGGNSATATVVLSAPAPARGLTVALAANSNVIGIPGAVRIAANQASASFTVTSSVVTAKKEAIITGTLNGTAQALVSVSPKLGLSVSVTPEIALAKSVVTATARIANPAPVGGILLRIDVQAPVVAPDAVMIQQGETTATFAVTSNELVMDTELHTKVRVFTESESAAADLTFVTPGAWTFSVDPETILDNEQAIGTITLPRPAPDDVTFAIYASSESGQYHLYFPDNYPGSVVIPAGQLSASFPIRPTKPTESTLFHITAISRLQYTDGTGGFNGQDRTDTLLVNPSETGGGNDPRITFFSVSPAELVGGSTSFATVTLSAPAPQGGYSVAITSNSDKAIVPALVTIPEGETSAYFGIPTQEVTEVVEATLTATIGAESKTVSLTIHPKTPGDGVLFRLRFEKNPTVGGFDSRAIVTLSRPAPVDGVTINIASESGLVAPANGDSIFIPEGYLEGEVWVNTQSVTETTDVPVTASTADESISAVLTLTLDEILSFTLQPDPVVGGHNLTGTITLRNPAGPEGASISLVSYDPGVVQVPAFVVVPSGETTASFAATTSTVLSENYVYVLAELGTEYEFGSVSVQPVPDVSVCPPARIVDLTLSSTDVMGGETLTATVWLDNPAPQGGQLVLVNIGTEGFFDHVFAPMRSPSIVLIPEGEFSHSFNLYCLPGNHKADNYYVSVSSGDTNANKNFNTMPGGIAPSTEVVYVRQNAPADNLSFVTSERYAQGTLPIQFDLRQVGTGINAGTVVDTSLRLSGVYSSVGGGSLPNTGVQVGVRAGGIDSWGDGRPAEPGTPFSGTSTDRNWYLPQEMLQQQEGAIFSLFPIVGITGCTPGQIQTDLSSNGESRLTLRVRPLQGNPKIPQGRQLHLTLPLDPSQSINQDWVILKAGQPIADATNRGGWNVETSTISMGYPVVTVASPINAVSSDDYTVIVRFPYGFSGWDIHAGAFEIVSGDLPVDVGLESLTFTPGIVVGGQNVQMTLRLTEPALDGGITVPLRQNGGSSIVLPEAITIPAGLREATVTVPTIQYYSVPDENYAVATLNGQRVGGTVNVVPRDQYITLAVDTVGANRVVLVAGGDYNQYYAQLHRSTVAGGPYQQVPATFVDGNRIIDGNVTAGTTYYYVLKMVFYNGAEIVSNEVSATPFDDTLYAPVISPPSGTYPESVEVTISCLTPQARIFYKRFDSNNQLREEGEYKNPLTIEKDARIVAWSQLANKTSAQVEAVYEIERLALIELTVTPSSISGGATATGRVRLNGAPRLTAITVALSSSEPAVTVPESVVVPVGSNIATFPISTLNAGTGTKATISATLDDVVKTATLTVTADTGKPWIRIIQPKTGALVSLNLLTRVRAEAHGSYGTLPKRIELLINGAVVGEMSVETGVYFRYPWTPTATGTYTLVARMTDTRDQLAVSPPVTVTVTDQKIVPTPIILPESGTYPGFVSVTIADDLETATIRYTTDGTDPANSRTAQTYRGAFIVRESGTTVKARAYATGFEYSGLAQETYTITGDGGGGNDPGGPLSVRITSPGDGGTITQPTPVTGEITAPVAEGLRTAWELSVRLAGSNDAWQVLSNGIVVGGTNLGVNGKFDPTLHVNGAYNLRLVAVTSDGRRADDIVSVIVEGNMKIGNFKLSYTDLTIPVAGIPITVTRSYDTLAKDSDNDFGRGWSLQVGNIRLQKSVPVHEFWEQRGEFVSEYIGKRYDFRQTKKHFIAVTFPGGKVMKFVATYKPQTQVFLPITNNRIDWVPVGDTRGTLRPVDLGDTDPTKNNVFVVPADGGDFDYDKEWRANYLMGYDDLTYNPDLWELKTPDGTVMHISENRGLIYVREPNGNALTIDKSGIHSSTGVGVDFTRDGQGRITAIRDPNGNNLRYTIGGTGNLTGFTDRENATTKFAYDSFHRLTSITDALGIPVMLNEYDPTSERLDKTHDAYGKTTDFTHGLDEADVPDNVEIVTDRLGNKTTNSLDARGNIIQTRRMVTKFINGLAQGMQEIVTSTTYELNGPNPDKPTSVTDALGRTVRYTYSFDGHLLTKTDPLNNVTSYTYDGAGNRLTETDVDGIVITTNTYDLRNNLISTTDALNHKTTYTYDARGLVLSKKDPLGHITETEYDAAGRAILSRDAVGHVTLFTYNSSGSRVGEQTSMTKADGTVATLVTTRIYDKNDHVVKTILPNGAFFTSVYDANGVIVKSIDLTGRVTFYKRDADGRVIETVRADGTAITVYDDNGRQEVTASQHVRENGTLGWLSTKNLYDEAGRIHGTEIWDGIPGTQNSVRMSVSFANLDVAGQATSQIDALGFERNVTIYDRAGRAIQVTEPDGGVTKYKYSKSGEQIEIETPLGQVGSKTYDENGNVLSSASPGVTNFVTYDALGRRITETDGSGREKRFEYDHLSRLIAVTDATGKQTRYTYDELGHKISQTDANNNTTHFEYDLMGRKIATVLPLGQRETTTYRADGRIDSKHDFNGIVTSYIYDDDFGSTVPSGSRNGRLLARSTSGGTLANGSIVPAETVSYTYYQDGNKASSTRTVGGISVTSRFTYDIRGRVVRVVGPVGTLAYGYDDNGNKTSLKKLNTSGQVIWTTNYQYDNMNRLSAVIQNNGKITRYVYDKASNRVSTTRPNGVITTYRYDSSNRLVAVTNSVGSSFTYTLDGAGRRVAKTDTKRGTTIYDYDSVGRLIRETGVGIDNIYHYDAVGNRTSMSSASGGATEYFHDANDRLITERNGETAITYSYDANGNLIEIRKNGGSTQEVTSLQYSFEDKLIATDVIGARSTTYILDAEGNRIQKTIFESLSTANSIQINYLVDTNTKYAQVVEEIATGGTTTRYDMGLEMICSETNGTSQYYLHDGQGSTVSMTDSNGYLLTEFNYDAFGTLIEGNQTQQPFLYVGQQFDWDLGLYYLRARYYAPVHGRFISQDPFAGVEAKPETLQKYNYTGNDPINRFDFSGKNFLSDYGVAITISALIIGGLGVTYYLQNTEDARTRAAFVKAKPLSDALKMQNPVYDSEKIKEEYNLMTQRFDGIGRNVLDESPWSYDAMKRLRDKIDDLIISHWVIYESQIQIFPAPTSSLEGAKDMLNANFVYVSDRVLTSPLSAAVAMFAEFQHTQDGGSMKEASAERQFSILRDSEFFIAPERMTPQIKKFHHHGTRQGSQQGTFGFSVDIWSVINYFDGWHSDIVVN